MNVADDLVEDADEDDEEVGDNGPLLELTASDEDVAGQPNHSVVRRACSCVMALMATRCCCER